jgi:hypothetical protein
MTGFYRFLHFFIGFLCCEYALARMTNAEKYRGFFMSVLHFTFAMGAFVIFSMNPQPIKDYYPWLVGYMGVDI